MEKHWEESIRTKLEVYEFPENCHQSELKACFNQPPLKVISVTKNEDRKIFILEFNANAAKLLEQPEYFLDPEDQSTRIRIRAFGAKLLLHSEEGLNERFIKVHFRLLKLGDVLHCERTSRSNDKQFLLTLPFEDASKLASIETLWLDEFKVSVKAFNDDGTYHTQTDERDVRRVQSGLEKIVSQQVKHIVDKTISSPYKFSLGRVGDVLPEAESSQPENCKGGETIVESPIMTKTSLRDRGSLTPTASPRKRLDSPCVSTNRQSHSLLGSAQSDVSQLSVTQRSLDRFSSSLSAADNKPPTAERQSTKTLVVSNLLDVDQQTIYVWIKSLLNVWPLSIQFSVDEERAIVKVPGHCHIDNKKLKVAIDNPNFRLRGQKLTVQELPSMTNIQVTCSNQQADASIGPLTLESFFCTPKYTGMKHRPTNVTAKPLTTYSNVFVVSFGSAEDVECVLKRSSYQLSKWNFAVAGFYPEVGMCNPDSLCNYPPERNHPMQKGDKTKQPILHINNIDEGKLDIDTLEPLMAYRKCSHGGEIESWRVLFGESAGATSVQIIYKESGVAERVYEFYKRNGLTLQGINLELELELPWLGPDHDDHTVRVSGLNDDLDPEMLKFYLSALSENVVTEMFFNKSQTRAVAMFANPIDYGRLIDQHHFISMKDFAQLKIQQEYKTKDLIATGDKLTKEEIELPLENLLYSKFNRDVDVHADKLCDSTDVWKITTESEAVWYILKQKNLKTRFVTLSPYSEFLEIDSTSALHKASSQLKASSQPKESKAADRLPPKTLLLQNLLDVDEQTIYFWMKSLMDVWPLSIQISADGENAIVKVPGSCCFDNIKIKEKTRQMEFHLQGEEILVSDVQPATAIQVICSSTHCSSATMEEDTLEAYFSNERYTGVKDSSSLQSVKYKTTYNNLPVFVVTYSNSQDVDCVLQRKPHKHGRWRLDVAEFYPLIGVCGQDSLCIYGNFNKQEKVCSQSLRNPVLHINDIDNSLDLDTLQLLMSHRKRTDGGEIASWQTKPGSKPGSTSVQIVYVESDVAERVFDFYTQRGLKINNIELEVELDMPWLTKSHDDHKVRLSGLTNNVDPEKIRFYLSALSDNVVSEIFFNENQTKAVAQFQHAIDYGKILDQAQKTPLKDCPQLRIQQEYKTSNLIATGRLTKDDLELTLENILSSKFGREVEVLAEEFPGTTNMWRISTECDAVQYILKQKHRITRYETLAPYSEFLGLHVTSGVHKKSQNIQSFVSDPLMMHFLLTVPSGLQKLAGFLQTLGMILAKDGGITINQAATTKNDRTVQRNWRKLRPTVEKFIQETFDTYQTGSLTQQVFDQLSPEYPKLVKGQPVISDTNAESQPSVGIGNRITIAGEREAVRTLANQLQQMIKRFEAQIPEKKTVKSVTFPNIRKYQIQYLEMIGFFKAMIDTHHLKLFDGDVSKESITIRGQPTSIEAVQRKIFDLLPKVTDSKISIKRKRVFLNVFKTKSAEVTIKQQLQIKKISAMWYLENKTISVYSGSKADSQSALDIIDSVVWESQYPAEGKLDDPEKKLVQSDVWDAKKAEMQRLYQPFEVMEMEDHSTIALSGLMQVKEVVIEDIQMFFMQNVKWAKRFEGIPDRVLFLRKYKNQLFKELEKAHNVEIDSSGDKAIIPMIGATDDVANCCRSLKRQHDAICKDLMALEHQAMIRHVETEPELLDNIGLKTSCLVVEHKDEQTPLTTQVRNIFSMTLPSGTICEVQIGDITTLGGDAIVNAANGALQHIGGLSLALVNRGGNKIKQECADHIRKYGELMEGQAFTSTAGGLNCKKVIHAVGPMWRGGQFREERQLLMCIDNCFDEADKHKFKSIAIPPIGTGIFEYPLEKAVKVIVDAVYHRVQQGDYLPQRITFVDNKEDSLKLFEEHLVRRFPRAKPELLPPTPRYHHNRGAFGACGNAISRGESGCDSAQKVLHLDIYGNTPADIAQCKNELTIRLHQAICTMIWSEKPSYCEDREFIQKLSAIQVAKLQRAADKLGVKLEVDQRLYNIKIVGLSKDVYAMSETISNVFKVIQKEENDVQQQMLLAKAVQWTYGDERGQWINFTPAVNKALEDAYFADPKANVECSTDTGKIALDLGEMTGVDGAGLAFKIERNLPSSQEAGRAGLLVKWPATWTGNIHTFGKHRLVPGRVEFRKVKDSFTSSLGGEGCKIIDIWRVQNPRWYQQYVILRIDVAKRLNKPEQEIETVPLWHGTTEEAASMIVKSKFDRSLTGKNAAHFGQGSYFAKNSGMSAADAFSRPNRDGEKTIIQARVITGARCQGHRGLKTLGYNAQGEQYNCAVDVVDHPTVFVIYDDVAAYPEYIIKYKLSSSLQLNIEMETEISASNNLKSAR